MKTNLQFIKFILCVFIFMPSLKSFSQTCQWAKMFGGTGSDVAYETILDNNGNIYITGSFSSTIQLGSNTLISKGGLDIFIAKMDSKGNFLWAKSAGGSEDDNGAYITFDNSGNIYVTGSFKSSGITFDNNTLNNNNTGTIDMFIVKLDPNGNTLASKSYGGSNGDVIGKLIVNKTGNIYIVGGYYSSSINFGNISVTNSTSDNADFFVVKFDSLFNCLWAKTFGGTDNETCYGIVEDNNENIYITGHFSSTSINIGNFTLKNSSGRKVYIVKLDKNGNVLWAKNNSGSGMDSGNYLVCDENNNVYLTGYFSSSIFSFDGLNINNNGNNDIFIAKFNSIGNTIWLKNIGGSGDDIGGKLFYDKSNYLYHTGYFSSNITIGTKSFSSKGGTDILLTKLDLNGNPIWSKSAGGSDNDKGNSVFGDNSGNLFITGFAGTAYFDSINLVSKGNSDIFIAKYTAHDGSCTANAGSDQTICIGGTALITASAGDTYKWSTGGTTPAITVNPTATSTYTVTITKGNCTASDNVVVYVSGSVPTLGQSSYFSFNGNANDAVGGLNGTVNGATLTTDRFGKSNSAYLFNGTNNFIAIPGTYDFEPRTINVWFNPSDGDYSDRRYVFVSDNPNLIKGHVELYILDINGVKKLINWTDDAEDTVDIVLNKWYNATITVDNNKLVKFYLNGCLINASYYNSNIHSVNGLENFIIGSARTSLSRFFLGKIDEVRIYNRTLTDCEIKNLYDLPILSNVNAGPDQTICKGNSTTLTATGGTNYAWSTGASTSTISVSPSVTTTYTITSKDGCNSATDAVVITVNNPPLVNAGPDQTICKGASTTLSATGGTTYSWSNGGITAAINVNPTTTTTYTVTATSDSCTATDNIVIFINDSASTNGLVSFFPFKGNANDTKGTYNGTVSGATLTTDRFGNSNSAYLFNGINNYISIPNTYDFIPRTINICFNASDGDYSDLRVIYGSDNHNLKNGLVYATIKDINGAKKLLLSVADTRDTVDISLNKWYNITISTDINKMVKFYLNGCLISTLYYNTNLTSVDGLNNSIIGAGRFAANRFFLGKIDDIKIFNRVLCESEIKYLYDLPVNSSVNAGPDQTICKGASTTLTATGGTTYIWGNGSTTSTISVSPSITTTYTVTSKDGCNSATDAVVITVNTINANAGNDITIGKGNSATLTATGGSTYKWSNGGTSASILVSPTINSTYIVTVANNFGCSATDNVVVSVIELCTANAGNDVTTCTNNDARLIASGGDSYKWSNGGTTAMISVSPSITSTYTVTITKGTCTASDNVVVSVIPGIQVNAGNDMTVCNGAQTTLTATGGTTYLWSNGGTTSSISIKPNSTSTYSVTATLGICSATDIVIVTIQNPPHANAGNDITIGKGNQTTLTATGGSTYKWSNGETSASIVVSPTINSTYIVTVTDNFGCSATDNVIVSVVELCTANAGNDVTTCTNNDARLIASGGDSYKWSNGAATAMISVSPSVTTTYTVTITKGTCTASDNVVVSVIPGINVYAGNNVVVCNGAQTTLTASGGTSYLWSNGATTQSIIIKPTSSTTYFVTATSGICSATNSVTVTTGSVTANAGNDVTICKENDTRLIATGAESYKWSNGGTTAMISVRPTITTTYTLTATTGYCTATDIVVVMVNNLNINAGPDLTICAGNSTTLNVPGADSYVWNDGYYTANRTVTPSVTTTYTVTGKTGVCTASDAVVINVNPMPALTTGPDRTINSGTSIILTASGATIYTWNTGANTGSVNVSPTITTTYKVTGSNNGCSVVKSIVVNVLSSPSANAGSDITICLLDTPRLTATGGAFYKWSTGSRNQSIIVNPTTTTTYTLTATSKNGATSSDRVVVTVVSTNANAGVDRVICYGSSTTLTATGGEKYKWNTGATTQSITVNPLALKCYAVTASVSAIKECSSSDIVVVRVIRAIANAGPDVTICKGNNVNLNSTGGQYYKWNTGATTSVMTVLPSVTTNYTVTISNALGCTASDAILVSIIKCKNIDNIPENFANVSYEDIFNVYPNPFNQSTTLTYSLNKPSNIEINLFDILGNKVETITNERKSEGSYVKNIDREKLVSGIYFVEFKTEDLRILKKIVIL